MAGSHAPGLVGSVGAPFTLRYRQPPLSTTTATLKTTCNGLRLIQLVVGEIQALARPSRENPSPTPLPLNSMNDDANCDGLNHEEVERAIDNLSKSGKTFGGLPRRDSMPMMMGRPYDFTDPRAMGPMAASRHHSIGDYDAMRPHSASNLQGFYAAQRFQGRPNETEQMIQAKRRLAAQRERELRNYHQEQQYNRSTYPTNPYISDLLLLLLLLHFILFPFFCILLLYGFVLIFVFLGFVFDGKKGLLADISGDKSDRSMSPAAMTEESRRDLIARQHRALYGNDSALQTPSAGPGDDSHSQAAGTPTTGLPSGGRGASPRGVDPFLGGQPHADSQTQQATSGANVPCSVAPRTRSPPSTASPPSNTNPGSAATTTTYGGVFEPSQPPTSSPTGKGTTDSSPSRVGPIGSRPAQPQQQQQQQQQSQQQHQPQQQQQQQQPPTNQSPNPSLSLRSTTPLPSPLSYGFSPNEDGGIGSSTTAAAATSATGGANNGSNGNNGSGNGTGTDAGAGSATQSSSAAATSRSASGNNSTSQSMKESSPTVGLGWGWRGKNQLGVQASVWG
ncbi:uncharacterized protein ARB_06089 [Trichophyton benhamiae CBS 112371]|uniref:Uncharacterized protein n=1 Tax=Arthroderma benhamiae (strain ATCC MYA-4681 / CBS 112371) TaxID=663331 RepID=D4APC2_ARTBC|nr:uncharacterized protein ARB_06089 [Trichophyton benhamiae CBS 112371]EFE35133.1 conserved hypothetical protein [Trichophyton benhamiae CBS 112371]